MIIAFTYCVTMKHVYMSTVVEADVCEEVLSMRDGEQYTESLSLSGIGSH